MPLPLLVLLGGAGVAYKVIQALTDQEWPGTEFPKEFRETLIDEHWSWRGGTCPSCDRRNLRKIDLTVDHIVPIRKGGRNSKNNAQVLCGPCNSSKGDRVSPLDKFVGRGGKRPRRRK